MTVGYIILFAFVLAAVLGVVVFAGIGFGKKETTSRGRSSGGGRNLDNKFIQTKWAEIEQTLSLGGSSQLKTAVLEADKLMDHVLKGLGVLGTTMGERLKNSKPKFNDYSVYDNLWFAHKVRNNIAHESSHELGVAEAKRAIEYFKKALVALGVIK